MSKIRMLTSYDLHGVKGSSDGRNDVSTTAPAPVDTNTYKTFTLVQSYPDPSDPTNFLKYTKKRTPLPSNKNVITLDYLHDDSGSALYFEPIDLSVDQGSTFNPQSDNTNVDFVYSGDSAIIRNLTPNTETAQGSGSFVLDGITYTVNYKIKGAKVDAPKAAVELTGTGLVKVDDTTYTLTRPYKAADNIAINLLTDHTANPKIVGTLPSNLTQRAITHDVVLLVVHNVGGGDVQIDIDGQIYTIKINIIITA
ncbi:hypothetical protein [Kluyvera genomosp. 3]|uniref:Uncharacterized protein n=1 Tax=Kluyvera genomosp. 3 TaxID=2774055 RepID=A0A6G9RK74_9ENTR|nr:hypothetical protein [Kluyvera genomosp. 3]QIR26693.1 hypothetical protein GY169_07620 [Kluyvera genomosp. 3]